MIIHLREKKNLEQWLLNLTHGIRESDKIISLRFNKDIQEIVIN